MNRPENKTTNIAGKSKTKLKLSARTIYDQMKNKTDY